MKFYDRTKELDIFSRIYQRSANEAQMTVLVGRRRIGKTELALRCGGTNPLLYFFVARKSERMLCQDFAAEIEQKLRIPMGDYSSFAQLFRQLMFISQTQSFTLVMDEFQDWMRINPSVFSEIQREWDLGRNGSKMNLIISGSVYSMMKRIFEDSKEPLFSRAQQTIRLKAFETNVLKEILHDYHPDYTPQDLLTLYGMTHGVAWYVGLLMNNECYTSQAMLDMLTEENSPFINEGRNLLIEEFGADYARYFSILSTIADGEMTRTQIENITGIHEIGGYIERLKNHFDLIASSTPIFAKSGSKGVRYQISDNFLTIWFRFFYKYQRYIESGGLAQLKRIVDRDMSTVDGFMLERYFRQKLMESKQFTQVGQFWDRKGEHEIDIVAVNEIDRLAYVYEVKKDPHRYSEAALKEKVDYMLSVTPQLKQMDITLGCLSLEDM